jgi:hypothetical protein
MNRVRWVGLTLILLGIIGLLSSPLIPKGQELIQSLLSHVSSVLIGAGITEVVIQHLSVRHLVRELSFQFHTALGLALDHFHEDRHTLMPLEEELKGANEVWLAWRIGSVQSVGGIFATHAKQVRLLLTNPDSAVIREHAKVTHRTIQQLQADLRSLTAAAVQQGYEVKWFDGPIGDSMVVSNPGKPNAKARIEINIPFSKPAERPSLLVSKERGGIVVDRLVESYKVLWGKGTDPS